MLLLKTENLISIRGRERQEEQRPGGCLCLLNMNQSSWRQGSEGTSAANRLIGEVVQSRRRPLLGPSPG